jgi:hypothetical protein
LRAAPTVRSACTPHRQCSHATCAAFPHNYPPATCSPLFVDAPYRIRVNSPQQEAFVKELAAADKICGLQIIRTWEDPNGRVSGACNELLAAEPADLGRAMLDLLERLTTKPVSLAKVSGCRCQFGYQHLQRHPLPSNACHVWGCPAR